MASAPPANTLPLFYNQLEPLSSNVHGDWKARSIDRPTFLRTAHAIPVTAEEFTSASRFFPIVFSIGDQPVPLALTSLNEGTNAFADDDGRFVDSVYVPAYVRRYPFMLARLQPQAEELSLCFDPSAGVIGAFEDGDPLFVDGQPSDQIKGILGFCEQFEQAGQRTAAFMQELAEHKLLMDGEITIQPEGAPQPFIYRGFQMVNEEVLRNLRGDVVRKMVQSGMLALIYAHLFSLGLLREVFERQAARGMLPQQGQPT